MNCVPILAALVIQYQAIAAPVLVPPPASAEGGGSKRTGTVPTIQYQALTGPVVVPNVLEAPSTVSPIYPNRVFPKRGLGARLQQTWVFDVQWEAPGAVAVPDLVLVDAPPVMRRRVNRAPYAQFKPMFGVEVPVPVMSWTGHFADRLPHWAKRRHARWVQTLAWDTVLVPAVVTAPDLAVPGYADRIHARRRVTQFPQPAWPPFVADVTVTVPIAAWEGEYVERVWPHRRLPVALHQSFALHPTPIPVVAVTEVFGKGRYTVPPRKRTFVVPPRRRHWTV